MGNSSREEYDELNDDSQLSEYKQLSYKLFHFRTYRLTRGSNGDFGCPFCDYKECRYTRLLLHAIQVAEGDGTGKHRANHYAMARYLAIDLAHQLKAEADQLSWSSQDGNLIKVGELQRELNDLIAKQRQSSDELQSVRIELIKGLNDIPRGNHVEIGIRNIGEIDSKVFVSKMEERFSPGKEGVELCSLWQEILRNPHWYPYQIIQDDNGKPKRLVKEDDPSLQDLKRRWGLEIHDAVVQALNDPELWNFKQNRKAKLDEVISYILEAVRDGTTSDIKEQREIGSCFGKQPDINNSHEEIEISEHKERIYKLLKSCTHKVRGPCGRLRCPFCSVEEDRDYNYLLRHAVVVAEGSSESAERRAMHFALAKYLVVDLQDNAEPTPSSPSAEDVVQETWELNTCGEDIKHKRRRVDDEKRKLENLSTEIQDLETSHQNLLAREQKSNAELQGARKELIKCLQGLNDQQSGKDVGIGIKQIGELDVDVFKRACRKRFTARVAEIRGVKLWSQWQEKLKDPQWCPLRIAEDDTGSLKEEVEEDETLRRLKHDWGDEVYNAIVTALHEYGPSRCRAGAEIWNFKENRKAELEEVISCIFTQLMAQNQKRRAATKEVYLDELEAEPVQEEKKRFKRRLKRNKKSKKLSSQTISQYFHTTIAEAARELNIGLTSLQRRCRELGIERWPHKKVHRLQHGNKNVQDKEEGEGESQESLEQEKKLMEEIPE